MKVAAAAQLSRLYGIIYSGCRIKFRNEVFQNIFRYLDLRFNNLNKCEIQMIA